MIEGDGLKDLDWGMKKKDWVIEGEGLKDLDWKIEEEELKDWVIKGLKERD